MIFQGQAWVFKPHWNWLFQDCCRAHRKYSARGRLKKCYNSGNGNDLFLTLINEVNKFIAHLKIKGNLYLSLCFTCPFKVEDFLNPSTELKGFDVCIDKGTFDAISLSPEDREEAKKLYVNSLKTVMKPGGFFIITSCNWTKEQLLQIFRPGTSHISIFLKLIMFQILWWL